MPLRSVKRRKRLSMTSLIDVIFLLLLFFMLSSTFSRFAEVEISAGGTSGADVTNTESQVLFLRLTENQITLNGQAIAPEALGDAVRDNSPSVTVLVSVSGDATAQALTDVLVTLQQEPGLTISVLEGA